MDERMRELINGLQANPRRGPQQEPDVVVGELVVADSGETRRVFLLTGIDPATRTLAVLLATNETEMATDLDMFIGAEESGAAYDVVVQAELYGHIFPEQLRKLVGKVDEETARMAADSLRSDGESLAGRPMAGPPLVYADDPRRAFKHEELADLRAVSSECRRLLVDGVADFETIDPSILLPPRSGADPFEVQDRLIEILDLLDEFSKSGHTVISNLFDFLSVEALGEIDRWRTEFQFDLLRHVFEMAGEREIQLATNHDVDDPQSALLQSLSSSEIHAATVWTTEEEAWDGLRFEETDSGVCRSMSRLVGAQS